MIKQILQSITQAEQDAVALVAEAEQQAEAIRQNCERQVATLWQTTKEKAKQNRLAALDAATMQWQALYANILSQAEKQGRDLHGQCEGKIDGLVAKMLEQIIHGDC